MEPKRFLKMLGLLVAVGMMFVSQGATTMAMHGEQNNANVVIVPGDYATIQEAINHAVEGDTVLVAPGTYYEHITMKSGIILSCSDPSNSCVISESASPSLNTALVTCTNCSAGTLIENFTIKGADGNQYAYGVGVELVNSHTRLLNNQIRDNYRMVYSGTYIVAYSGQGIKIVGEGKPRIIRNFIYNNRSYNFGGGISIDSGSEAVIYGNIIKGNRIFNWGPDCDGGGLAIKSNKVVVSNNIFDGNWASGNSERGGGIFIAPGIVPKYIGNNIFLNNDPYAVESDNFDGLSYNLFFNNETAVPSLGPGNIIGEPKFVNPVVNDYHLMNESPAIDSGDPQPNHNDPEDPDNPGLALYPALGGLRNDMGAYGGQEELLLLIPIDDVTISAPFAGEVNQNIHFLAEVNPDTATIPITYTWQVSEHDPVTQITGISDEVSFLWTTTGEKTISVTATSATNTVTDVHTILILVTYKVFLPLTVTP
ncbi:MAG: hypothetical protein JW987_05040 [Anaerolineaceae bacterium]|nr:hypothetical protein [Anaerolineaceae bacterium]